MKGFMEQLRKLFELLNDYPWTSIFCVLAVIALVNALRGKC